jgi:hypothetical protein
MAFLLAKPTPRNVNHDNDRLSISTKSGTSPRIAALTHSPGSSPALACAARGHRAASFSAARTTPTLAQSASSRRIGFSFCGFGRSLRLRNRRQPPRQLDKLSRRPVRRRTSRHELFLVFLPRRPFASKLGRQSLEVGLQRGDVCFEGEHQGGRVRMSGG